jgi:hypothetical protein
MPIIGIIDSAKTGNLQTTAFESIQTVTVGAGGQSTISFTSIPSTYTHLQLRGACRSSGTGGLNNVGTLMRFNNDTGSNYWWHEVFGTSTGPTGGSYGQADSQIYIQPFSPDNGSASGIFGVNVTDILDYANTNKFKVSKTLNGDDLNGANSGSQGGWVALVSGLWRNTGAINRIDIYMEGGTNLVQNSTYALYGVKG